MFIRCRNIVILAGVLFSVSCGYGGDGEYIADGKWPFKTYTLKLPELLIDKNSGEQYFLKGYKSHGSILLRLRIESAEPIDFHDFDASVELEVTSTSGKTYFYRNAPLNKHYKRMNELQKAVYPLDDEWRTDYKWDNEDIDKRVVPFQNGMPPKPSKTAIYWHIFDAPGRVKTLKIKFENIPQLKSNLASQITLISGWK